MMLKNKREKFKDYKPSSAEPNNYEKKLKFCPNKWNPPKPHNKVYKR